MDLVNEKEITSQVKKDSPSESCYCTRKSNDLMATDLKLLRAEVNELCSSWIQYLPI